MHLLKADMGPYTTGLYAVTGAVSTYIQTCTAVNAYRPVDSNFTRPVTAYGPSAWACVRCMIGHGSCDIAMWQGVPDDIGE